tara:strand:+ start:550 stop:981 length:432 start_codon:yes stop_codon:yes gene_type:complete
MMKITLLVIMSFAFISNAGKQSLIDYNVVQRVIKPSTDLVLKELRRLEVKHPRTVLAQSILETGHYKSKLTRTHNNLFGFRTAKGYLKFGSWKECCAYYKRWQDRHYKPKNHANYYAFLVDVGYAEDPQYITKVKTIVNEYNR